MLRQEHAELSFEAGFDSSFVVHWSPDRFWRTKVVVVYCVLTMTAVDTDVSTIMLVAVVVVYVEL